MAHLIEQLYVDEIDFEDITSVKLIDLNTFYCRVQYSI
jgi:hypothetical protein